MTDPILEALWKRVVDDWDDDGVHGAFLKHCQETDQLLEAAVRYRGMAGDRDRGTDAEKRLGAVAMLAMARLESQRTSPADARKDAGRIVLVIFFTAASAALLYHMLSIP